VLPPAVGRDTRFGAFRHGDEQQLVEVAGRQFVADHGYSIYPIGLARSADPPPALLVCDDTLASIAVPAECRTWPATVLFD